MNSRRRVRWGLIADELQVANGHNGLPGETQQLLAGTRLMASE